MLFTYDTRVVNVKWIIILETVPVENTVVYVLDSNEMCSSRRVCYLFFNIFVFSFFFFLNEKIKMFYRCTR